MIAHEKLQYKVVQMHDPTHGKILTEEYKSNGRFSRSVGPAYIVRKPFSDTEPIQEEWYQSGLLHRDYYPARTDRYQEEEVKQEWWRRGKLHNEAGAAILTTHKSGVVVEESYWQNGERHRPDGPAVISRDARTGETTLEAWYFRGKPFVRDNLPWMIVIDIETGEREETFSVKLDRAETSTDQSLDI